MTQRETSRLRLVHPGDEAEEAAGPFLGSSWFNLSRQLAVIASCLKLGQEAVILTSSSALPSSISHLLLATQLLSQWFQHPLQHYPAPSHISFWPHSSCRSDSNILFSISQLHLTSPSGPHSSCHSDYGGNSCAVIRILLGRPISVTAGCQLLHRQKHLLGIPSSLAFLLSPRSYPVLPAAGVNKLGWDQVDKILLYPKAKVICFPDSLGAASAQDPVERCWGVTHSQWLFGWRWVSEILIVVVE